MLRALSAQPAAQASCLGGATSHRRAPWLELAAAALIVSLVAAGGCRLIGSLLVAFGAMAIGCRYEPGSIAGCGRASSPR
jgi:hypothetical protein